MILQAKRNREDVSGEERLDLGFDSDRVEKGAGFCQEIRKVKQRPSECHEFRKQLRDAVFGRGVLTWDDGMSSRQVPVEVRNISENGVQVIAPIPIAVGVAAHLTGKEFRCIGTVRYCESDRHGFLVGLEFNREPHYKNAVPGE